MSNILITDSELDAILGRVEAGDEPWATAWDHVLSTANAALDATLQSVVRVNGSHQFEREHYPTAIRTKNRVRDLALAYRVTGDDSYARKAIDQIHFWFLDADNYQLPRGNGQFATIRQYITIPTFFYAAELLRGHQYWGEKPASMPWRGDSAADAEAAVETWATEWQATFEVPNCNNIYVWRAFARAVAGTYAGDDSVWERALSEYRSDCTWNDYEMEVEGGFQFELWRDNGYRYQLYRMKAHAMFCEVARVRGLDCYAENGLKRAFDFMAPFVFDPSDWPYGATSLDFDRNHEAGVYELAYSVWQDQTHLDVIQQVVGRPVDEGRLLGDSVTLTHGNRHLLDTSKPPDGGGDEPDGGGQQATGGALAAASTLAIAGSIAARRLKDERGGEL